MSKFFLKLASLFLLFFLFLPTLVLASSISSPAYAWSSKLGWVNFSPDHGGVSVTSSSLTGYAWSTQSGWINLAPTQSGVKNDGQGVLSGSAWGAQIGWIDFAGVTINPVTGVFSGQATGDIVGTLNFSCDKCQVITAWRANSNSPTSGANGGGSSGYLVAPTLSSSSPTVVKKLPKGLSEATYLKPTGEPLLGETSSLVSHSVANKATNTEFNSKIKDKTSSLIIEKILRIFRQDPWTFALVLIGPLLAILGLIFFWLKFKK
jgi:hypothetical protein